MRAIFLLPLLLVTGGTGAAESTLRVSSVAAASENYPADDQTIIFHDEFDVPPDRNPGYVEYQEGNPAGFTHDPDAGLRGGGMTAIFEKGQVDNGNLKVFLGRTPAGGRSLRKEETFNGIYWRVYVKHEPGWERNPAKLARATCLMSPEWKQGSIAHVWGGKGDSLCIDPATGIVDSQPVTTRYNDFANLKWLGNRHGNIPIFSPAESGRWVCVESHIRLNTPGEKDGVFELWVDGKPEASRDDLDWHGQWADYGINAVFLENYWNDGSTKRQSRFFDNFVIATRPIGPAAAERPVRIERTLPAEGSSWEAEISSDAKGEAVLWRSRPTDTASMAADASGGAFTNGATALPEGRIFWVRVRRAGETVWSPWHSPFR